MYRILEAENKNQTTPILIEDGPFEGVVYRYTHVKIDSDAKHIESADKINISYKFEIIKGDQSLRQDVFFHETMNEIFGHIMDEYNNVAEEE